MLLEVMLMIEVEHEGGVHLFLSSILPPPKKKNCSRAAERLQRIQGETTAPRQPSGSIDTEASLREFILVILHLANEKCLSEKGIGAKPLVMMFQYLLDNVSRIGSSDILAEFSFSPLLFMIDEINNPT